MRAYLNRAREPWSSFTHLCGAILSGVGLFFLVGKAFLYNAGLVRTLSATLFGLSLVALYTASSVYHFSNADARRVLLLRKCDHAMIYVLIAGTYTPILLGLLPYPRNVGFTAMIWVCAAVGILMKLCWFGAPRWLQTVLYLVMGWAILFDPSLFRVMPSGAIGMLVLGGVSYTVGAVLYMIKKPNWNQSFGFHELFHVFVMLGSLFHYLLVFCYLL